MSQALNALAKDWRQEAEDLRSRYGDDRLATLCEAHAGELESLLKTQLHEELTLKQAARISGYSYSHLRRLMDSGDLPNAGVEGRPRVRLGDLPFKAGRASALGALSAARRAQGRAKVGGRVRPIG